MWNNTIGNRCSNSETIFKIQNNVLNLVKNMCCYGILLSDNSVYLKRVPVSFFDSDKWLTCLLEHAKKQESWVLSQDFYHLFLNRTTLKMSNHTKLPQLFLMIKVCVVGVGQKLCQLCLKVLFGAWPCGNIVIFPVSVSQDASGQSQSVRSQKRKRPIDASKCKAKPGVIQEPNRGSNVRLTEEWKKTVTVEMEV